MSDIIIRQAAEQDIPEMARLDALCFSSPWSEAAFEQEIKENGLAFYIVAELALTGEVIGYAGLWTILEEGHITNVAVHPDHRRRHIGEALVQVLLEETGKAGIRTYTLEVRASNTGAIELYKKFGFLEVGVRKGYYEDNQEDALIMWTTEAV